FSFAEGVGALGCRTSAEHPAEHRIVLGRRRLRVREAQQVAVRPTIALLILHGLAGEFVSLTTNVPTRHRIAQTTAPTAQSIDIFREVEQVRADTAYLPEVLEG